MLLSLIYKEIVHNVLSLRFMVTFVLFFVLTMVSVYTMTTDYHRKRAVHDASVSLHRDAITNIAGTEDEDQKFHNLLYGGGGIYGDRAPLPLGVFVNGLEHDLPSQVNVSLWQTRKVQEDRYENPLLRLFATPDYAYVVNIVISLLALLFVFDSICGEKEQGTLKLLLANSVPRDLVLLGKWVGGYLSLAVPLLASLFAAVIYVILIGSVPMSTEFLSRLGWVVAVSLLYVSVFFALGMMISTATHKASTALLVSLFVWVCWILVVPNLAAVAAKFISPVPTPQKVQSEKVAIDRETQIRRDRIEQSNLGYGKRTQQLIEKIEQDAQDRKERIDQFYEDKLRGQIDWSQNLSRLSPSASFVYAATDLAGTGVSLYSSFRTGSQRFSQEFNDWAQDWDDRFHEHDEVYPEEGWLSPETLPALQIVAQRLDDTVSLALTDMLLLLVYNALFFMLSYAFFLRYDVT
jgi:ABC-type transport system involved in multi-copper enzyme maturation permease subunit